MQTSEVKPDLKEVRTSMEEVKLVIKEMHQKVIEYGINQEEKKNEQIGGRGDGLPNPVSGIARV
jgi:uncharacterized coiled-coil DUF342 family protein